MSPVHCQSHSCFLFPSDLILSGKKHNEDLSVYRQYLPTHPHQAAKTHHFLMGKTFTKWDCVTQRPDQGATLGLISPVYWLTYLCISLITFSLKKTQNGRAICYPKLSSVTLSFPPQHCLRWRNFLQGRERSLGALPAVVATHATPLNCGSNCGWCSRETDFSLLMSLNLNVNGKPHLESEACVFSTGAASRGWDRIAHAPAHITHASHCPVVYAFWNNGFRCEIIL